MEYKVSLKCAQNPTTCRYPEPPESNLHLLNLPIIHIHPSIRSNVIHAQ
jgi:hypothetical protein